MVETLTRKDGAGSQALPMQVNAELVLAEWYSFSAVHGDLQGPPAIAEKLGIKALPASWAIWGVEHPQDEAGATATAPDC